MLVILSAIAFAAQAAPLIDHPGPRIIVEGFGSAKNPPNVATLSYSVQGEGQTSDQAVAAMVTKSAAIEGALQSIDPSIDLRSAEVEVQAVRGNDCKQDRYDETLRLSEGECAIKGHVAKQEFTVRTSRVADAGTMVGLAGRHGAFDPSIGGVRLADERDAKRQAIAAALADARFKAEAIAASSNAALGNVLSASLDGAVAQDIVVTGARRPQANLVAGSPVTVKVAPGPVETTARVTVTYAISR